MKYTAALLQLWHRKIMAQLADMTHDSRNSMQAAVYFLWAHEHAKAEKFKLSPQDLEKETAESIFQSARVEELVRTRAHLKGLLTDTTQEGLDKAVIEHIRVVASFGLDPNILIEGVLDGIQMDRNEEDRRLDSSGAGDN